MKIFITGITGTLGRGFVDYLKDYYVISGVDRNEASVADFKKQYPDIHVDVGDFVDVDLANKNIDLLIHLAAMKHVDLCEQQPSECVLNNVIKTAQLFRSAHNEGVKILFMSTDKAVEPISMYGYSKALGEGMALEYGGSVVRSGNILSSSGSVLEVWDKVIINRQPIDVTHKDMVRYFVKVENLVPQIWKSFIGGKGLIIPKMDKRIKIIQLLSEKLKQHGYSLKNYPGGINYIGLRPGEKLVEILGNE